ncbi:MAG: SPOR domain-containing protein [Vicingus serpentipes]|nr:SPOR domain-containing protein [Vicingus serpentipes]
MLRYISVLCFSLLFNQTIFSQGITATHDIQAAGEPNEYVIKTTISGLEGVDIARITYFIPKEHIFKKSPNNSLFHKREDEFVKFYIMGVPPSGIIDIELNVLLSGEESVEFPVEFQYSQNEEKKVMNLSPIKMERTPVIIADVEEKEKVLKEENDKQEEEQLLQEKIAAAEKIAEEEKEKQEKLLAKQQEEERLKQQKVEEEERAKQEAALVLKQEEERLAQERITEETRLAKEEKTKQEELAIQQKNEEGRLALEKVVETKRAEEEKAKEEAKLSAKQQAEEERLAQEKAAEETKKAAELAAKQQAEQERLEQEKLAEEKARQEAEGAALLTKEEMKQEESTAPDLRESTTKYAVQILALSNYSEQRVATFCNQHGLLVSEISTEKVGGLTKVRYGAASSLEQAKEIRNKLVKKNITGAFIVKIN